MKNKILTEQSLSSKLKKRKLSYTEQFFWVNSNKEAPFNICIAFRLKDKFTHEVVRECCLSLQKRYYLLRCKVKKEDNGDFFYQEFNVKGRNFAKFISSNHDDDWKKVIASEVHTPFDNEEFLFRFTILESQQAQDILITCHHLIADGKTLLILTRDFLRYLYKIPLENFSDPLRHSALEDFIPDIDCNDHLAKSPINFKKQILPFESAYRTGFIYRFLAPEETAFLQEKCKEKNVTVHSFLISLLILQMAKKLKNDNCPIKIKWESPVDLRPFLPTNISQRLTGCNIAILSFFAKFSNLKNVWLLSKFVKKNLYSHINSSLPAYASNQYKNFINKKNANHKFTKWTGAFIGISNLGKIDKFFGTLTEKIDFIFPLGALHANFHNSYSIYLIAHTFNNSLKLTFLYPIPLISEATATDLVNQILDELKSELYV